MSYYIDMQGAEFVVMSDDGIDIREVMSYKTLGLAISLVDELRYINNTEI